MIQAAKYLLAFGAMVSLVAFVGITSVASAQTMSTPTPMPIPTLPPTPTPLPVSLLPGLSLIASSSAGSNAPAVVLPSLFPIPTLPPIPSLPPLPTPPVLFHSPVCSSAVVGSARCNAHVLVDSKGKPNITSGPAGFGPAQLQGAYAVTGLTSGGRILAIVDAYGDTNIASDLATYSKQFGLPALPSCTGSIVSSPIACFQKADQNGGTNYPAQNSGWSLETSLDVEVAHAMCPDCKLLLVEARSTSYTDLLTAVDRAITMGASVVSNSYGSGEFNGETSYDSYLNKPGVAITFSTGDNGYNYGTQYPASSQYVTAVGGTSLKINAGNSYNSETVWSGTGSGCSAFEPKPSWQKDTGCPKRMVADVAADADPYTGAAVYDSVAYLGQHGWFQVGGTSLASPIVAAAYALHGVTANTRENSLPYASTANLHDILQGNNGNCRNKPAYFCTAEPGFDGPTGFGTLNGTAAF